MHRYVRALALVGPLLGSPRDAAAQGAEPNLLTSVKNLNCIFPLSVSAGWQDGEPAAMVRSGGVMKLRILDIDTQDGSARFEGASSSHVVAQLAGWNLHFLDIEPAGALSVTTVFSQVGREGQRKAVQSRTDYLPITLPRFVSTPTVSQHYGLCEPLK